MVRASHIFNAVMAAVVVAAMLPYAAYGKGLSGRLSGLAPGEEASAIVVLSGRVDAASALSGITGRSKGLRTRLLVMALKGKHDKSMKGLAARMDGWRAQGRARNIRQLWIMNAVALTATREVLDELASLPGVDAVYPDEVIRLESVPPAAVSQAEDNLALVNAPSMWEMGHTGQGVVVAGLDSGVDFMHPDLAASFRGITGGWYDPYGSHAAPYDADGHGTATMGVIVGGDAGGTAVGVAPGAQWIAAKIFDDDGTATLSAIHLSFQWLMDPDGDVNTDDAPDVVNCSWGQDSPGACSDEFAGDVAMLRQAGILAVFAAGNFGPAGGTDVSPANNAGSLSVGAVDSFDNPLLDSSRGPSSCGGGMYPVLSAPGSYIRTTTLSYGGLKLYAYYSGTSLSAPHVAGAAALLLDASPGLTPDQLETALTAGAADIPPAGPDYTTGYGRLDVLAAYNTLSGEAPPVEPASILELAEPADAAVLLKDVIPTFTWTAGSAASFEIEFSKSPDFVKKKAFLPYPDGTATEFTPDWRSWKKIRGMSKKGRSAYWRVKGTNLSGDVYFSDTSTFVVVKY